MLSICGLFEESQRVFACTLAKREIVGPDNKARQLSTGLMSFGLLVTERGSTYLI
jgi:hypothetical protein